MTVNVMIHQKWLMKMTHFDPIVVGSIIKVYIDTCHMYMVISGQSIVDFLNFGYDVIIT